MNWTDFYLICFLVGFALSVLAVLAGGTYLHLPHLHFHHGIHMPGGPHGMELHPDAPAAGARGTPGLPWFNFGTLAAFLAWFGGTGYLLERYTSLWFIAALLCALLSGLAAASAVFWSLARLVMAHEAPLDPADYEMAGVLGRISISIRPGGTGEIVYSQEGTRRVAGARAEDGIAIPKGAEVLVTRYEKGIAYVRPWQDPAEDFLTSSR